MLANLTRGVSCAVLALAGISAFATAGNKLSFSPFCNVQAEVVADGQKVIVTVKKNDEIANATIEIETEKKLQLAVNDFNFDGHSDFSISHTDDGMGTYTITEIYVYTAKEKKFLRLTPKCGDEFINVVISKTKRTLTNSYVVNNRYKTCTMKF